MSTLIIKDISRNHEIDRKDMAAIEGGISFPSVLHGAPIKLIPPPQPVTKWNTLPPTGDSGGYHFNFGGDVGSGHQQD